MRTNYQAMYEAKRGTVEDCLDIIRSGMVVAFAAACNAPEAMLNRMHTIADRVTDVKCIKGHEGVYPFVTMDGMNGRINTGSFFFGRDLSQGMQNGNCTFIPADMCDYSTFTQTLHPCDVFAAAATPMDENGNLQVSLCMMYEDTCYASADKIILEVNPNLPRVRGGLEINIRDVTCLTEVDYPINEIADAVPTPEEVAVAKNVRSLMRDGDCIQIGIGSLPNAIANEMRDLRDLGLHTEMATNTIGRLISEGVINGQRKNFKHGQHLFIFAGGSPELYRTLGENPACRIVRLRRGPHDHHEKRQHGLHQHLRRDGPDRQHLLREHRPADHLRLRRRVRLCVRRAARPRRPQRHGVHVHDEKGRIEDRAHAGAGRRGHDPPQLRRLKSD